ncbi:reverse transcriptase, partial [Phytophthora megakarya]
MREQREVATAKPVSPGETPRKESLKLRVSNYMGREGETLLCWLVELDTAVMARRIADPLVKVAFAMSCLGGRARGWAYGCRLTDPTCFSTYESFKEELKLAFEPPQNEFRSRAEFLDLQQGKHDDVHAYAQQARYLVSNAVTDPMDEATKVVTLMKGLRDGPVKTYLFRGYPSTLEAAITLAMQEKFSLLQAKLHTNVPRPPRPVAKTECPEPMDLSYASAVGQQKSKGSNVRCFRCGNMGHFALQSRVSTTDAELRTAAPSEGESHWKIQDDMPNLVILKVKSMTKRADSLRVLVYSGASNNYVRQQSLPLLDFEEKHVPRSQLEVRLATGAIVKTETRVIRARFSYRHQVFVEGLHVLDLDDKFDMVLGMPWLARHRCLRESLTVKECLVTNQTLLESGLHEAGRDQAGLDDVCPRVQEPAGGITERSSIAGPGRNASESGIHKKKRRRRHKTLRKSRSGTETLHGVSAGQTQVPTAAVEMLNVLTRACTGYQYEKRELENPPTDASELISLPVMSWKRFARTWCLVGKNGLRTDPEKVRVINEWPTPSNVKEPAQFLGLATYLCNYVDNYAGKIRPLSQLLKKEAAWIWTAECQQAFDAPILAVADQDRAFHVVCDASNFAIGCAIMQLDHEGRDRVVYYQSRQLKPAERNYPVYDKELLAMKYALARFRVYLLGNTPFVVYTDHASLRTVVKSPHISQRMARWLSFFAEYNFRTADINRIDVARAYTPSSPLLDEVKAAYADDADAKRLIEFLSAPSYEAHDNAERIVVPNDPDLRNRIMYEYHDVPTAGHPGREKTYSLLTRDFYWNHQYKWVRQYVRTCDVCQRVKPAPHSQAPLQPLPTPSECWESISMDFVFGLPRDSRRKTGIVAFVDRFSKMVHLAAVAA